MGGNLKSECAVCTPALSEAIPVGAIITARNWVSSRKFFRNVVSVSYTHLDVYKRQD